MIDLTDRLYYDQPYMREFDARVTKVLPLKDGCRVSLDVSAFYPTSGGQPYDTGTLNGLPVVDVEVDSEGEVWHSVLGQLTEGGRVHGIIDWGRRFDHMQQHAGEHMIAGSIWRHFEGTTIGLHLGAEFSTIDVSMPDGSTHFTDQQICLIEEDVNAQIQQDAAIRCWFPEKEELASLPLRKPPTVHEHVRIVAIGDNEMVACGGTHPSSTGQIGLIKIIDTRPSKGKVRVAFVCGMRAVRDYRLKFDACRDASTLLSTGAASLSDSVSRLLEELAGLEHTVSRLRQEKALYLYPSLMQNAVSIGNMRIVCASPDDIDMDGARALASKITSQRDCIALLAVADGGVYKIIFSRGTGVSADMGKLLKEASLLCGAKGGGKSDYAQGSSPDSGILNAAMDILKNKQVEG